MKKILLLALLPLLAMAQNVTTYYATPQVAVPTAVTQTGTTGTTTYYYWVVAIYAGGNSGPAGPTGTSSSNSTLSATNYNTLAFLAPTTPLSAVTGYDILRTTSQTPPTGACACAVATNQAASPVNDQSNTLSAYTVTTASAATTEYLDNSSQTTATLQLKAATKITGALSVTGAITQTGGGGQVTTTTPYTAFTTLSNPNSLIAATSVTDTVAEYWSQIFIPTNTTLTGACLLNGATVTTDKHIVILANAAGTIVANSALAGASDSGASRYQCQAFTATVAVVGPQTYWVGTQPNGTTDNFLAYATGGAPTNYGTVLTTCAVFGTLCNLTPTVTFTTAQGPLMMVY